MSKQAQFDAGVNMAEPVAEPMLFDTPKAGDAPKGGYAGAAIQSQEDAPPCSTCGSIMIRSGSCYKCANCGTTSGCA
jgi:ribonucleoside-diphosphate reductase alpha chain